MALLAEFLLALASKCPPRLWLAASYKPGNRNKHVNDAGIVTRTRDRAELVVKLVWALPEKLVWLVDAKPPQIGRSRRTYIGKVGQRLYAGTNNLGRMHARPHCSRLKRTS